MCYFSIFAYWEISILFSVSDYYCYELIEATRNDDAVSIFTGRSDLNLLTSEQLEDEQTEELDMC